MTGFACMLQALGLLAFLPSLVLTIDTCDLVCQDKEFLHNSCYGEVCVLLQPGYLSPLWRSSHNEPGGSYVTRRPPVVNIEPGRSQ